MKMVLIGVGTGTGAGLPDLIPLEGKTYTHILNHAKACIKLLLDPTHPHYQGASQPAPLLHQPCPTYLLIL